MREGEAAAIASLKLNLSQIREMKPKDEREWLSLLQMKLKTGQIMCLVLVLPAHMTLHTLSIPTVNANQPNQRIAEIHLTAQSSWKSNISENDQLKVTDQ
jgi:hypothetical protein